MPQLIPGVESFTDAAYPDRRGRLGDPAGAGGKPRLPHVGGVRGDSADRLLHAVRDRELPHRPDDDDLRLGRRRAGAEPAGGWSGQISLGHGAFVLIGAYTAAILGDNTTQIGTVRGRRAMAVVGGDDHGRTDRGLRRVAGGDPSLRLTGPYLAVATLALIIAAPSVFERYKDTRAAATDCGCRSRASRISWTSWGWTAAVVLLHVAGRDPVDGADRLGNRQQPLGACLHRLCGRARWRRRRWG